MFKKMKDRLEAKDAATRQPYGVKVSMPSRLRTTGGTNWSAKGGPPIALGGLFHHMNTEQFTQALGPVEEPL